MVKNTEERLWKIFENTNKWLEYAERKNTYALTFIGFQLTLLTALVNEVSPWLYVSLVCLGICFLLTILSLFPVTWIFTLQEERTKKAKVCREHKDLSNHSNKQLDGLEYSENLIFYGHISRHSNESYVDRLEKRLGVQISGVYALECLCNQIVVNSRIAATKFKFFKLISALMVIGQLFFIVSILA